MSAPGRNLRGMSEPAGAIDLSASNPETQRAHEILARDFTDRYLRRSGMTALAYSQPWDPENPLCDYETTWWRAKPNRWSVPMGKLILGKQHGLSGKEIDSVFVAPFVARAPEITAALPDYPVCLVNGHDVDLQAALSLMTACMGIARASDASYQKGFEQMTGLAHGVATRGLAPIVVGRPKLPGKLTFLRLQQLVVNPHLSFPINQQMIESGIPQEYRRAYNAKLRQETIDVAQGDPDGASGYRTLWSMAPGGTPDLKGEGEHEGKTLTKLIEPATVKLFAAMGCGLMPVYTSLGRGRRETTVEVGPVVPPDELTDTTLISMMADLAEYRRAHGEPDVYYEGEV